MKTHDYIYKTKNGHEIKSLTIRNNNNTVYTFTYRNNKLSKYLINFLFVIISSE